MDKEIKISISKRTLTYYSLSVIAILLSFFLGYMIRGIMLQQSKVVNKPVSITRAYAQNGKIENNSMRAVVPSEQVIEGRETGNIISKSDSSWDSRLPETSISQSEQIVRYYSNDSQKTAESMTPTNIQNTTIETKSFQKYVASKNGTKYYPIDCKSADRIKEENRIYFSSAEEAELEGLSRTTTCK